MGVPAGGSERTTVQGRGLGHRLRFRLFCRARRDGGRLGGADAAALDELGRSDVSFGHVDERFHACVRRVERVVGRLLVPAARREQRKDAEADQHPATDPETSHGTNVHVPQSLEVKVKTDASMMTVDGPSTMSLSMMSPDAVSFDQ